MHKLILLIIIGTSPVLAKNSSLEQLNQATANLTNNLDQIQVHKKTTIVPVYTPSTVTSTTTFLDQRPITTTTVTPPQINQIVKTNYHYTTHTAAAKASLSNYQRAYRKLTLKLFLKNCLSGTLTGLASYLVPTLIEKTTGHKTSTKTDLIFFTTLLSMGCYKQLNQPITPYYSLPELEHHPDLFSMSDDHFWQAAVTQLTMAVASHLIVKAIKLKYLKIN